MMVYRIYVEKKKELANEAASALSDIRNLLHAEDVTDLRIVNRYDVEGVDADLFSLCVAAVFSEPQLDMASEKLDIKGASAFFGVEYHPGS
ncbi:MAG: hypothetical protein PHW77_04215, partial [Eubacteriales bacterium]|nr:hypothetical protein [Eubacteriales bacterium]